MDPTVDAGVQRPAGGGRQRRDGCPQTGELWGPTTQGGGAQRGLTTQGVGEQLGSYIQTESQSKHPFTEEIIIGFQKNNLIQMQKW